MLQLGMHAYTLTLQYVQYNVPFINTRSHTYISWKNRKNVPWVRVKEQQTKQSQLIFAWETSSRIGNLKQHYTPHSDSVSFHMYRPSSTYIRLWNRLQKQLNVLPKDTSTPRTRDQTNNPLFSGRLSYFPSWAADQSLTAKAFSHNNISILSKLTFSHSGWSGEIPGSFFSSAALTRLLENNTHKWNDLLKMWKFSLFF